MTGGGGGGKRGRGHLGEDEEALWHYVARSIAPIRGKQRVPTHAQPNHEGPPRPLPKPEPKHVATPPHRAPAAHPAPSAPVKRKPEPQPLTLERRKSRRIARGAEEIDARLDLHGMTQEDAHAALNGFIRRCHAQGFRIVLVITGKGGVQTSRHDDPWGERPRGVLKRNVPRWLAGHDLGGLVIGYATAHVRHGGEGALYVRLRRKA